MAKLPPGFRFHPTDVELVMYYLKRKIMGKKLLFEAISELNIYKFSPWDLPDKCCYKSKDLEWYFFCPRERKYASGGRMNRATEAGYWKTTGKDRTVIYNEKIVGSVKTLVFHQGQAPRGQRTDWVIHEYKFEDKEVADAGLALDSYALCKVFQKSGPGPKNGAQYGAPFKEEDWEVDEEVSPEPISTDVFSGIPVLPHNQGYSVVASIVDPGSTSGWPSSEPCQPDVSSTQPSIDRMPLDEPDDDEVPRESNPSNLSSILPVLPDNQSCLIVTSMVDPGCPSTEPVSSRAQICTNEMLLDEKDDEFICLFANFTEDTTLLLADNEKNQNFNQDIDAKTATYSDGNDIYHNLGDLKNWAQLGDYSLNPMILPEDVSYLELNDLETPLNHSAEAIETGQSGLGNFYTSYNPNPDVYPLCSGSLSSCTNLDVRERQLPMLPESYVEHVNHSDVANNFRYDGYQGFGAANGFNFCSYEQPENSGLTAQNLETGSHFSRSISAPEQLSASVSLCGGFSMLVKAEVTLGVGGCTNDALSAILGDCCVFTFQSYIYETDLINEVKFLVYFGFYLAFKFQENEIMVQFFV